MRAFISRPSYVKGTGQARYAMLGSLGLTALLAILALHFPACTHDPAQASTQAPTQTSAQDSTEGPTYVLRGKVFDVHDGDTIKVQLDSGPISVRFHGIDAPELKQTHGAESRAALAKLVGGREVEIEPTGQFSHERMVAIVYAGDLNVNEQMIKEGDAWAERRYLRKTEDADWCTLEQTARSAGDGIWALPSDQWIAPWEWRKSNGQFTDYSRETADKCIAAIGKERSKTAQRPPVAVTKPVATAQCGTKMYCREMASCEEAQFYLTKCGVTRLDGDSDGVPCEDQLCGAQLNR